MLDQDYNPDYGTLKVKRFAWSRTSIDPVTEVPIKRCTLDDLSFDDGDKEGALREFLGQDADIEAYLETLMCIDNEDFMLKGNYESIEGSTLLITLDRCQPEDRSTCKSDEEFDEWIKDRMMYLIQSTQEF